MRSRWSMTAKMANTDSRVFDIVRKRYVALTPEEKVRQDVIHFLHYHLGYPLELMQVEAAISLNGLLKRCDIVVYNRAMRPLMIVECKKNGVPVNAQVLDQASRYNLALQVPFLLLTNGVQTVSLQVDYVKRELRQLSVIPSWNELVNI